MSHKNAIHGRSARKGKVQSRAYTAWINMRQRCNNPNSPAFKNYGGRGISVCRRWNYSFVAFFEDMGEPSIGMTLERRDTNKGYSPSNCVWASRKQQMNNVRYNRRLTYNGEERTMAQWAEVCGVTSATMHWRLANWNLARALSTRQQGA